MKFLVLFATIAFVGVTNSSLAHAQDISAGEKLYKKVCKACHGPTAKGMASFPKLADKSVDYLTMRLEEYRSGKKVGPNTALMAPRAAGLSDEEISNITNYIVTKFGNK